MKSYKLLMELDQDSIAHNPDNFIELYSFLHTAIFYYKILNKIKDIPTVSPKTKPKQNIFEGNNRILQKGGHFLNSPVILKAKKSSKSPFKMNNNFTTSPSSSTSLFNTKRFHGASLENTSLFNKEDSPFLYKPDFQDQSTPSLIKTKKMTKTPIELVLNEKKSFIKNLNPLFSSSFRVVSNSLSKQSTYFTTIIKSSPKKPDSVKLDVKELSKSILSTSLSINSNSNIINKSMSLSPKIKKKMNSRNQNNNNKRDLSSISVGRIRSQNSLEKREIHTERQGLKKNKFKLSNFLLRMGTKNGTIMESIEESSQREKKEDIQKLQKDIIKIKAQTSKLIITHQRKVVSYFELEFIFISAPIKRKRKRKINCKSRI